MDACKELQDQKSWYGYDRLRSLAPSLPIWDNSYLLEYLAKRQWLSIQMMTAQRLANEKKTRDAMEIVNLCISIWNDILTVFASIDWTIFDQILESDMSWDDIREHREAEEAALRNHLQPLEPMTLEEHFASISKLCSSLDKKLAKRQRQRAKQRENRKKGKAIPAETTQGVEVVVETVTIETVVQKVDDATAVVTTTLTKRQLQRQRQKANKKLGKKTTNTPAE